MNRVKLGDFIEQYGDGIHGTPNYDDNGMYYFVNGNNLINGRIQITDETLKVTEEEYEKIKRPLSDNTLLLSINGTLGRVAVYNGEKIALGKSACYLNIKNNKNKYFVKGVLDTQEFQKYIQLVAHGSTIKNLAPSQVVEYEFNSPNEGGQEKIAFLLKLIDDKIDNNNEINTQLEAMARTIYDYWFLQFDFPDESGKPYKSSGGKMVWNEELKKELPEGWRVGNLSEIASITMGSSPKGESLNEDKDGITFYQGKTDFGYRFPMARVYTKSPIRYAEVNDILLSVRAPVGDMNITVEKCCIGRGLAAIHSHYQSFLFYLMLRNQHQFDKYNNKGTTFGAITKDELIGLRVVIPNEAIIKTFDNKISDLDKRIFSNELQNQELISLRDFLLPLLMNGQVGFREC